MNFFDLNIPIPESQLSNPQNPSQFAILSQAISLGYTSIAYNHTIKSTIMSDKHICNIPRYPIPYILKNSPNLANSVQFHRKLLGLRDDEKFKQFTRLTVCVESLSQCLALNPGNSVLKSYDLVAVRPLNQVAFDYACEKAEVDLISIDFGVQLPFQIKFQSLQDAVKRGIYFEILYSPLLSGVQSRTQMVLATKLLVQWTQGKNLIISSAAESRSDIRGPCDVANLCSVLGMSKEHAKAAMSKNCRSLLLNAARKKQYYKSAVKVDAVSDAHDWDNISGGEGDLQLDDIAKSFADSFKALKKPPKSHGTQVKGLLHGISDKGHPPLNLFASKTTQMFEPLDGITVDSSAPTPSKLQTLDVPELSKAASENISPTELTEGKHSDGEVNSAHVTLTDLMVNKDSDVEVKCMHISPIKDIEVSDCENVVNAMQTDKQSAEMIMSTSCNDNDTTQNGLNVDMISLDATVMEADEERGSATLTSECHISPNRTRDYATSETVIQTDNVLQRETLAEILPCAESQPEFVPSNGVTVILKEDLKHKPGKSRSMHLQALRYSRKRLLYSAIFKKQTCKYKIKKTKP